jgi:hypothetical protein
MKKNIVDYLLVKCLLILVISSGFITGCTHFQQTLLTDEKPLAASKSEDIQIFFSVEKPAQTFKELGSLVVTEDNEKEAVLFLKKKAAAMGADALLNCEVHVHTYVLVFIIIPIPIHSYTASAIAVKYTS